MNPHFWSSDWFAGLLITILVLVFSSSTSFKGLERKAYDWGVRSTSKIPSDRIAVIAIDDQSIENIGRWPWPRDLHAEMINTLTDAEAKVIGQTVFFPEPQIDPGTLYIRDLIEFFSTASFNDVPADMDELRTMLKNAADNESVAGILEFYLQSSMRSRLSQDIETLKARLFEAEQALDTDSQLAASLSQANNVVLAMHFKRGTPVGKPDQELPGYVLRNSITQIHDRISARESGLFPVSTVKAVPPIPEVGLQASAIGHLDTFTDLDGGIRPEPLVLQYYDRLYPSISLQIAAKSLNLNTNDIRVNLAESIELGSLKIKTDSQLMMNTFYYSDINATPAFPVDSFYDVLTGKIPPDKYRDKIVLIGVTAIGINSPRGTPMNAGMAPVLMLAHSVSTILNEDFFIVPEWGVWAQRGVFLFVGLYLMLAIPRMKSGIAVIVSLLLFITIISSHYVLMTSNTMWIQLMGPAVLLVLGQLLVTTKYLLVTGGGKVILNGGSSEANQMTSVAFHDQGKHNKDFRDIDTRMTHLEALEDTVIPGHNGDHASGSLLLDADSIEKPRLGRYEIEKELGKGAMGIVYLGKDPKVDREVAIKTLALAQEFEQDELEEVKQRFFHQAEIAARLNHPNIVEIFEAGEENDLAYISMEFLNGHDLARYGKADNLLDIKRVIRIVWRCAEGLAFAHQQGLVHSDIKPANIMYDPDTDSVKIIDFGIGSITDSSKSKSGTVLGTPSYMSPEQLAGKKIDGRSDIFSLGVVIFQLLTGTLPFTADSMASLMFKITSEEAPDIRSRRIDLPSGMSFIIKKVLAKDPQQRHQSGTELATDLKAIFTELG
jgi:CHASE2 domain-containing sensor protein/tRNA A-37 threonylcarbamoyl transferase component Bud32